jgi:hypothetical protein
LPVFASNWCLRTRSARVSASLMSISFAPSKGCGNIWGGVSTRVCGACDARRERMGRIRSARALQLLMPLTGERFPGVRGRVCAGGKIWGGNFDPRERSRRGGPRSVGRRAVACWSAPSAAAAELGWRRREATIECLRFIAGSVASKRGWSSANFVFRSA